MLRPANGNQEVDTRIVSRRKNNMVKLGKRYKCEVCGTEMLCTKAGEGTLICCDKEMTLQEPKPLPSSD
jgi:desulfoferrodoxin-like iron-binding protein